MQPNPDTTMLFSPFGTSPCPTLSSHTEPVSHWTLLEVASTHNAISLMTGYYGYDISC